MARLNFQDETGLKYENGKEEFPLTHCDIRLLLSSRTSSDTDGHRLTMFLEQFFRNTFGCPVLIQFEHEGARDGSVTLPRHANSDRTLAMPGIKDTAVTKLVFACLGRTIER